MRPLLHRLLLMGYFAVSTIIWAQSDTLTAPIDGDFVEPVPPIPSSAEKIDDALPTESPFLRPLVAAKATRETSTSGAGLAFPIEAVIEPSADGRVSLTYGEKADPPALQNPFDCRLSPKSTGACQLKVSSVSVGARPLAVVNGRTLALGQRVDSFNLVHIERGAVFLEKNGRVLRVPVGQTVVVEEGRGR